jgi:UDP-2,3-diacylglucosamine pyrophosphatase LpxH
MSNLFAIGDVHGDLLKTRDVLSRAGLVDEAGKWTGGDNQLVFTGDLTDRYRGGIEVISLVKQLQKDAAEAGGYVQCLMGNHDALILARAFEHQGQRAHRECSAMFHYNGGFENEAKLLSKAEDLMTWLQKRPFACRIAGTLFQHADSADFYRMFAPTGDLGTLNDAAKDLASTAQGAWRIFYEMTDCREWDREARRFQRYEAMVQHVVEYLELFQVRKAVHGHTRHEKNVPLSYMDDRVVNIDGSMSLGYRSDPDRGFVLELGKI